MGRTAVYFDLDGTLIEYAVPFGELVADTLPVEATDSMRRTYSESVLRSIRNVEDDPYERAFAAVADEHGLEFDAAALADAYVEREVAATRIEDSVFELVRSVSERHPTGILTNGEGRIQRRKLEANGLTELVDTVLVSNEIGVRKPDDGIFETAMERLPADTHLYVGDTYEEDIVPAEKIGFETVYVGDSECNASVSADGTAGLANVLNALL